MTATLLVIVHEATRTGAPRVLLDLLDATRGRLPVPLACRLEAEGPLSTAFRDLAEVDELGNRPAAVLVNGAAAAGALHEFGTDTPTMVYVHEEDEALDVLPSEAMTALVERADRVLCVSARSHRALERLGVDGSRLAVLPPAVPATEPADAVATDEAWSELGLDATRPLVIGCGEASWRKGADLFIDVARRVRRERTVQFAWAGRRPRSFARLLDHDTRAVGLDGELNWLGELVDVTPVFSAAQVLLMTSREDPQPLVPLEAAVHGTATAGFAIGGVCDLAADGAAIAVPYPDTVALGQTVMALLDDPDLRKNMSAAAERRRDERHSLERTGASFIAEVLGLLGGSTG